MNKNKFFSVLMFVMFISLIVPSTVSGGYYRYDLHVNVDYIAISEGEGVNDGIYSIYRLLTAPLKMTGMVYYFDTLNAITNHKADNVYIKFDLGSNHHTTGNLGDFAEGYGGFSDSKGATHNIADQSKTYTGIQADTVLFLTMFDDDPALFSADDQLLQVRIDIDSLSTCTLSDYWVGRTTDAAEDCGSALDVSTTYNFEVADTPDFNPGGGTDPGQLTTFYHWNSMRLDLSVTRTWISSGGGCSRCI